MTLGVLTFLFFASVGVGLALVIRALGRANRVASGRRSAAPLSWLASPRAPARFHRRLRRAVGAAEFSVGSLAPAAVPLRDVAGELVGRAVAIDDCLVAAGALHPAARRPRLLQLASEVREVEGSAARLHQISSDWRRCLDQATASVPVPPPDLHQRLDAVEAALRELPTPPPVAPDLPAPVARLSH